MLPTGELAIRLGAAALAGALVGIDRERHRHSAGLRTMILVSTGSALLALVGCELALQASAGVPVVPAGNPDAAAGARGADAISRVVQGIIGGIGFLGAGVVMRADGRVRGITTAASIWVTAAIGLAMGLGMYTLGAMTLALALIALVLLKPVEEDVAEFLGRSRKNGHAPGQEQRPPDPG
ncbi:MAG: MgtC/SapB family protein [Phycisphaerae bacterium]|nr:MgtC/SapB family protein [Phycisphaerae bacterium]